MDQEAYQRVQLPDAIVSAFPPSADSLLTAISRHVTDALLLEISSAEYGDISELHLQKLREIRETKRVDSPFMWHPREVLELYSYSDPLHPISKTGCKNHIQHIGRTFCCAALLLAGVDPEEGLIAEESRVTALVDSVLWLGDDLPEAALRFLVFRMLANEEGGCERAFLLSPCSW